MKPNGKPKTETVETIMAKLRRGVFWLGGIFAVGTLLITLPYVYHFWRHHHSPADSTRWAELATYFGLMLALVLSFATLVVVVVTAFTSSKLPVKFEESRLQADRIKTTVDISTILFDREFYIYVSAPAWEIVVKWLYWEGPDGDEYRRTVCGTKFLYKDAYEKFKLPEEVNRQPYQNLIRFERHNMPYGYKEGTTAISELSEHQVLYIWTQFWCRLQALLEEKLVDRSLVRSLFADWYESWLEFMLQLRFVGKELTKGEAVGWFSQIEEIEKVLFEDDPKRKEKYQEAVRNAREKAAIIVKKTKELHDSRSGRVSDDPR